MTPTLQLLFSTPIVICDIPEIPQADHDFLLNSEYHVNSGSGGLFGKTKNTYILKDRVSPLTEWIQQQLDMFAYSALACKDKLKITQSWCLKHNNEPQKVFSHAHPNSIVSGAYYVDAPEGTANIRFTRDGRAQSPFIKWQTDDELIKEQTWMWDWHEIPVQTGRLVLFPSHLFHSVEGIGVNPNSRCVLSFNTWFDGPFGDPDRLFELGR